MAANKPNNQAMVIYSKVTDPIAFCEKMALTIASLVGCNQPQGGAVALVCLCEGLHPVDFMKKYHLIQGKPSMKPAAMLAEFRMNHGGIYRVLQNTPKISKLELTDATGEKYTVEKIRMDLLLSRWPWISDKDNKEAGWRNCTAKVRKMAKDGMSEDDIWEAMLPFYKDNYGTEADWANMLFSRLTGEVMRAIAPELAAGVYTPEEIGDVIDGELLSAKVVEERPTAAQAVAKMAQQSTDERVAEAAAVDIANGGATAEDVIDVPFEPAGEAKEPTEVVHHDRAAGIETVRLLFVEAFGAEKAEAAIAKSCEGRRVAVLADLTQDCLKEIATKLRTVIRENREAAKN